MTNALRVTRRTLGSFAAGFVASGSRAYAFGESGAFDARALLTGDMTRGRTNTQSRWGWEVTQRTSAPAKLRPSTVRADDDALVTGPFAYWSHEREIPPLTPSEIVGLRRFLTVGGVLFVDDAAPAPDGSGGSFTRAVKRELARVLPESVPIALSTEHVLFRTFYLLRRPEGRILGPKTMDGIVRGNNLQVIFSTLDVGGALARGPLGTWEHAVTPGGEVQREHAVRLAVNVAMYVLCSNYKDDQVHAPFLMRRRAMSSEP